MRIVVVALASGFIASSAGAFAFRVGQVPNGPAYQCSLCHLSPQGGGARNVFGTDVGATIMGVNVNWAAVCPLDSDGDGFTNGEELGDPSCTWMQGDMIDTEPTSPSDPNDFPSGMADAGVGGAGGEDAGLGGFGGEDAGLGGFGGEDRGVGPDAALPDQGVVVGQDAGGGEGGEGGSGGAGATEPPAEGGDDGCQQTSGGQAPLWLLGLGLLWGRRGPRRR